MAVLLKRVRYAVRKPMSDTDINGDSITSVPTFPYNPESKTQPTTAKRWATSGWMIGGAKFVAPEVEFNNDPFSVRIIALDKRAEGGRAYKVIDDQGRKFDLREDQLMEAIRLGGIEAGGQIIGGFVWGIRGSQMTLTFHGGRLYEEMKAELDKRESKKTPEGKKSLITARNVVAGGIYLGKQRRYGTDAFIYVGRLRIPGEKTPKHAVVEFYNTMHRNDGRYVWQDKVPADIDISKLTDEQLFKYVCEFDKRFINERLQSTQRGPHFYCLYLRGNVSFEEQVGKVNDVTPLRELAAAGTMQFTNGHHNDYAKKAYIANKSEEDPKPDGSAPPYQGWSSHVYERYRKNTAFWEEHAKAWFIENMQWADKK